MNFIAIDFEAANRFKRDSICEVALVVVENGEIAQKVTSLIQPPGNSYNQFNTDIHGITALDTEDAPTFDQFYRGHQDLFELYPLIAHNASYDMSQLRFTLDSYGIDYPSQDYLCTYVLAKKHLTDLLTYKLNDIADYYGVQHGAHRALEDATCTALVAVELLKSMNINSLDDVSAHGILTGRLYPGGYDACRVKPTTTSYPTSKKISDIDYSTDNFDQNSPFYGKGVCFTGTLEAYTRDEAHKLILEIGGQCYGNVTKSTNYLIMGEQDYARFGSGHKTGKIKKAEKLKSEGQDIELLSEIQFMEMV